MIVFGCLTVLQWRCDARGVDCGGYVVPLGRPNPGLPKLARLLRPGGLASLWWTLCRVPERPYAFGIAAARLHGETPSAPNEPGRPQFEPDVDGRISDLRSLAGLVEVDYEAIPWSFEMDAEQVRAHYESMIAVRRRPDAERRWPLDALAELVTEDFGWKVE